MLGSREIWFLCLRLRNISLGEYVSFHPCRQNAVVIVAENVRERLFVLLVHLFTCLFIYKLPGMGNNGKIMNGNNDENEGSNLRR